MPIDVMITLEEQKAIASLERLAKKWPKTLQLFSWSGSLTILKKDNNMKWASITTVAGIPNDGGDPYDINQNAEIHYLEKH